MKLLRHSLALAATLALVAPPATAQSYLGGSQPALGAFGGAVAVAGDQVLVGEPNNNLRPGMVYIYSMGDDGAWTESGSFTAPDGEPGDGFGSSIAVDDDRILVGASGAVHTFERSGGMWSHTGSISEGEEASGSGFGATVALSGEWALVGAPAAGSRSGAVHLYRDGASGWEEVAVITPEEATQGLLFGASIAMAGPRVFIGAIGADERKGKVMAYDIGGMGAEMVGSYQPDGLPDRAAFGGSIAFDGETLLVGAPAAEQGMGVVYAYHRMDGGELVEAGRLLPFDGAPRWGFGASMALRGLSAWIGAPGSRGTGAAYVFEMHEDGSTVRRIAPSEGSGFGNTLAVGDDVAVVGLPSADFGAGRAAILSESDGTWSEAATVMSDVEELPAVTGGQIDCAEGEAAHFDCSEIDLVAFMPTSQMGGSRGVRMNDVWGWTDPETGKEYALAGMMDQLSFVDISNPANPVYVGRLPMTPGARAAAWRDVKVYDDHAFVVADGSGQHGMQVFDLTRLRDFDGTPETFEPDALYENIASAHNIVINPAEARAYVVGASGGGETCGGGLHMVDVSDPTSPAFAGCFADPQTGRASTGYSHDAQCVTYQGPDERYQGHEICLGSNETALSIADVTDPENPVAVARATYPNFGYSHQGWLTDDHRYFYMNDELDELQGKVERTRTLIWDLTDLEDPQLAGEYMGATESTDHNLYIVGDLMYQSNYQSGLRIIDISDRENPEEVGYIDTVPYGTNTPGFGGSWSNYPFFESGIVIVTSGNEGLFIVKPRDQRTISE